MYSSIDSRTLPPAARAPAGDHPAPARGERPALRRARLLETLRRFERTELRLVTMWAVGGAGKTMALMAWSDEIRAAGARVRWVGAEDLAQDGRSRPIPEAADWVVVDDVTSLVDGRGIAPLVRLLTTVPDDARVIVAGRFEPPGFAEVTDLLGGRAVVPSRELAFTAAETAALALRFDILLPVQDAEALTERTGGWAAGLGLAMPFLLTEPDRAAAIVRFGGDQHQVADYLTGRVLDALDDADRDVLMRTAVATDVPLELAVTLTGRNDVGSVLDRLATRHLFVDRSGDGFRVHPVLATFMRAEFRRRDECSAVRNHLAAAEWFEARGLHDLALEQALLSHDATAVAGQVERSGTVLLMQGRTALVATALRTLPVDRDSIGVAVIRLGMDAPVFPDRLGAEDRLAHARAFLHDAPDEEGRRWRPFLVALGAFLTTEPSTAEDRLRELGTYLRETAVVSLDAALVLRAAVAWCLVAAGRRRDAEQLLRSVQAAALRAGYAWLYLITVEASVSLAVAAGDWRTASAFEAQMGAVRFDTTPPYNRATARAMVVTTVHAYERCEPVSFTTLHRIEAADLTGSDLGLLFQVRALLLTAALDTVPAPRDALARLLQLIRLEGATHPRTVAAVASRVHYWAASLHGAAAAADVRRLLTDLLGPTSLEVLTLRLPGGSHPDHRTERTLAAALDRGDAAWTGGSVVQAHLALATHARHQGRQLEAAERVRRALDVSEEFGYAREFLALRGTGVDLVRTYHGTFGALDDYADHVAALAAPDGRVPKVGDRRLPVALTPKEQELLLELPAHQTVAEIAAKHHLSANTIKTHLRSIYGKLSATGRTEAVSAARECGLL